MKYLLLLTLILPLSSWADFHLISLDEIRVDYINYFPKGRDPLITENGLEGRELGKSLSINIESTLLKYGYWNTLVHSATDSYSDTHANGQFRSVGLQMELGIRPFSFLDLFYYHHSQHVLDTELPYRFPVADGVGIHIYIYSNKRRESLLNWK